MRTGLSNTWVREEIGRGLGKCFEQTDKGAQHMEIGGVQQKATFRRNLYF